MNYIDPADCVGTRLLACLAIATSVAAFLFLYAAVAHREPIIIPGKAQLTASSEQLDAPSVKDVAASAVVLGNEESHTASTTLPDPEIRKNVARRKQTKTAAVPKKRRTHLAKAPIRPEVRTTYAQAPPTFAFAPFGGF